MAISEHQLPNGPVGFSFTTRVRMGDYEGDLTLSGTLNDVRKAVRLLPEAGIEPVRAATWQTTPDGIPLCPRHGAADAAAREARGYLVQPQCRD